MTTALRVHVRTCALLAVLLALTAAARGQPVFRPNPLITAVEKEPSAKTAIKVISVTFPKSLEPTLRWHYTTKERVSGNLARFSPEAISAEHNGIGVVSRRYEKENVIYELAVVQAAQGTVFEIIVDGDRFVALADGRPQRLVAGRVLKPVPWEKLVASTKTEWPDQLKDSLLASTVRLHLLWSCGTGTIVEPPAGLEALLKPGEELVLSAGHVLPFYAEGFSCRMHLFQYDKLTAKKEFADVEGRILRSSRTLGEGDVSWAAFVPPKGWKIHRAKIATAERWYAWKTQLFRVGCAEGKAPHHDMTFPVRADRIEDAGVVAVDIPSKGGDSGGALFDPDGYLVGVCSHTANDEHDILCGEGLIRGKEPPAMGRKKITTFVHPQFALRLLDAAEEAAREERRWAVLQLPFRAGPFGTSKDAAAGIADSRDAAREAVRSLLKEDQEEVEKKLLEAIQAYEAALNRKAKAGKK